MVSRPLTVLQVLPALESGGVERGTLEVARELVRHGHRSLIHAVEEELHQRGGRTLPYEESTDPDLIVQADQLSRAESAANTIALLEARGIVTRIAL